MDDDKPREPEPSFGPDEEGDVPLRKRDVGDDPKSWVHIGKPGDPPATDQ